MSWTRLTSITTNNGSNIIAVNSGSTTNIKVGDALLVEGFDLVEIEGVFANQLQINSPWDAPTQSNISAAVLPTFGDFNNAVEEIRKLRQVTTDNLDAMEKWWTQSNGTVAFQSYNGDTFEVRTAQEMDSSVKQIEEAGLESIAEMESQAQAIMTDVTSFSYARTEADMETDREAAKRVFAGSGMIHSGKHQSTSNNFPVNEGIFTNHDSIPNVFSMGRTGGVGASETEEPVFNLSGVAAAIKGLNNTGSDLNRIKFPQAPRGTEVYDSATGVVIDYATEVDPKYGDVAATDNEAVARAFGTFKAGDVTFLTGGATYDTNTQVLSHPGAASGIVLQGIPIDRTTLTLAITSSIYCEYSVKDSTSAAVADPTLATFTLQPGEFKTVVLSLTGRTKTGVYLRLDTATGSADTTLHFVGITAGEVVTHPVDLVGFEWFLRPINEADPILYPNGLQQCKLTSVDGIATVENTFRPLTHFEVYPGDTTSRGRGFNIFDGNLTDAQLKQQFQKKSNNVCRMADGTIAQWTLSQRTIRGLGNGDWDYINPQEVITTPVLKFGSSVASFVAARGNKDFADPYIGDNSQGNAVYYGLPHNSNINKSIGMFRGGLGSVPDENTAINGECYLYVVATVPRLNQGAYHPTLNPYGTCHLLRDTPGSQASMNWYNSPDLREPLVTKNCFITAVYADSTGYVRRDISGFIGSQVGSARPDGKFFDGIYANGLNGIIDWRKPAYPTDTPEQAAKVLSKVSNGTYRGREYLKFTKYIVANKTITRTGSSAGYIYIFDSSIDPIPQWFSSGLAIGGWLYTLDAENGNVIRKDAVTGIYQSGVDTTKWAVVINDGAYASTNTMGNGVYYHIAFEEDKRVTVEGEFTYIDVMGDPANIFQVHALKNGWIGGWIPVIPDGTPKNYPSTRRALTTPSQTYTTNNGDTWSYSSSLPNGWDSVTSRREVVSYPANAVDVWTYKTFASPTKPSALTAVYAGTAGLLPMLNGCHYNQVNGGFLQESLLGYPAISTGAGTGLYQNSILSVRLDGNNGQLRSSDPVVHAPLNLAAPTNNAAGFKAIPYQVSNNQECSLNFAFAELKHDGTDWGDNGQLPIASNVSTYTNDNGVLCLYGTHTLAIPYGFSKNRARPGTQEKGVDL